VSEVLIRRATLGDARAIADVYNYYVANSTATFDTEPKSVGERIAWLTQHGDEHPVFVAESEGGVVGWGALSPYRERPAWRHTAEVAVYLSAESTGKGIGAELLGALVDAAREVGHHVLLSQIVSENTASLRMTERVGFERVGTLRQVGRKFDRWIDLELLILEL
jgi:phosphinothricin acetyltransferase